jgi:hypothetical protein
MLDLEQLESRTLLSGGRGWQHLLAHAEARIDGAAGDLAQPPQPKGGSLRANLEELDSYLRGQQYAQQIAYNRATSLVALDLALGHRGAAAREAIAADTHAAQEATYSAEAADLDAVLALEDDQLLDAARGTFVSWHDQLAGFVAAGQAADARAHQTGLPPGQWHAAIGQAAVASGYCLAQDNGFTRLWALVE